MTQSASQTTSVTPAPETLPPSWRVRRWIWDSMFLLIFRGKKALPIPLPPAGDQPKMNAIPLSTRIPQIGISNILVADRINPDEFSRKMQIAYAIRRFMYRFYPANQPDLPPIDRDMKKAMSEAFTARYARLYPPPQLPPELADPDAPDLGGLAVASPYACFLERRNGEYVWDFSDLDGPQLHQGLEPIHCRVTFEPDPDRPRRLRAASIDCSWGLVMPGERRWAEAVRIALCAASTQTSLVRHFNWVHLACGAHFAIATRNTLPSNHPLCRLLWPHMYGTQNSNHLVTLGQMLPNGEFECIFSFTHAGMCDLFSRTHGTYRITTLSPDLDWTARGMDGAEIDTPVQDNLRDLYGVFHRHALRYLDAYFPDDAALRADGAVHDWLLAMDRGIPNGITALSGPIDRDGVTKAGLARLIAGLIMMAAVHHEQLGSLMWNYQLWVDRNPVRIYSNGQGLPVDVFQRLVNANFNLNVRRAKLAQDFSYMGLDGKGKVLFARFLTELHELSAAYGDPDPHDPSDRDVLWRIRPLTIDANINA